MVTEVRANACRTATFRCIPMIVLALAAGAARADAQPAPGPAIAQILIDGNQRVEGDAIRVHIQSRQGEPLNEGLVDQDVKAIYKMGFFDQVTAELRRQGTAVTLIYHVKERPMVSEVKLDGMKAIRTSDDKVLEAIKVHAHSILDPERAQETVTALKKIYEDKGYLDATVTFQPLPQPDNQVIAVFNVRRRPAGRDHRNRFRRQSRLHEQTVERRDRDRHPQSAELDHRQRHARSQEARRRRRSADRLLLRQRLSQRARRRARRSPASGNGLTVTFNVDEGQPYKVGGIEMAGDLKFPEQELRDKLTLKPGTLFRGSTLQHDVLTVSDFYSNRGYAFVNVNPRTQLDPIAHIINVTFAVTPGQLVLVDRIRISGNTKTSDKVIRRELRIQEQESYSAEAIRESKARLDRLGFFEETRITTAPARQPDKINLDVAVREANTGSFQVAGGFSTSSSVFGNFRIGNTNLFGGGQSIALDATVGFLFQNYSISYTEPYFLDIPLTAGLELYDSKIYFQDFDRSAVGFSVRTFYPLTELGLKKIGPFSLEDVTAGLQYKFESVGIGGITSPTTTYDIRRYKGYTQTSEIAPSIRRFTVNNPIDPRLGSVQTLTVQIAGLGGSNRLPEGTLPYPFLLFVHRQSRVRQLGILDRRRRRDGHQFEKRHERRAAVVRAVLPGRNRRWRRCPRL